MLRGLTQFQPQELLTLYDNIEFIIRLVVATILGGLIGLERVRRSKEAGVRTHCIVCLTAAVFMILSKYAFTDVAALSLNKTDNARIAAQVVSGISFLGAGIIFKEGKSGVVRGLTTAAGIWATASVGLAIGGGMYVVGFAATLIILFLQFFLHKHPAGSTPQYENTIRIRMKDLPQLHDDINRLIESKESIIDNTRIKRTGEEIDLTLYVRSYKPFEHKDVVTFMDNHPDVYELSI